MTEFSITPATEEEKTWAAELMASSAPWTTLGVSLEQCMNSCHSPLYSIYIIHSQNNSCGVIILQDKGAMGSPYIKSIAIAPEFRNQGIGKKLLDFAEDHYRKNSRFIFLCVSSFNEQAQKFYQANGYAFVGELENYVVDGFSEMLMYKRLQ